MEEIKEEKIDRRKFNKGRPYQITKENAREMQARGVAKHKENVAKRKKMKEDLDILLRISKKKNGKIRSAEQIQSLAEAENVNCDAQTAILVATVQRAMAGDMQAVQFIRDTIGEKPSDKVEIDASKTIEEYAKNHKVKL